MRDIRDLSSDPTPNHNPDSAELWLGVGLKYIEKKKELQYFFRLE